MQQGNPEFDAKRQELYDYYHPLEISPSIPIEEKAKLMEEWYMMQSLIMGYCNFHVHWNDLFISRQSGSFSRPKFLQGWVLRF